MFYWFFDIYLVFLYIEKYKKYFTSFLWFKKLI